MPEVLTRPEGEDPDQLSIDDVLDDDQEEAEEDEAVAEVPPDADFES